MKTKLNTITMRNRSLLIGFLAVSVAGQAQISEKLQKIEPTESSKVMVHTDATKPAIAKGVPNYLEKAYNEAEGIVLLSEDFAAGIPGTWTNTGAGNEEWEYRGILTTPNVGTGSRGAYATGTGPIQSTTAANGFVIFDSDWWDNGGTPNGTGDAPLGSHRGALTLPSIDCSTYSGMIIEFTEYIRHYASFNYVIVSTDGFTTSDTVYNGSEDIPLNESSDPDHFVRLNVSDIAAGEADVRVRFMYASDDNTNASSGPGYYFWQIDDIVISTPPDNDLTIDEWYHDGANSTAVSQQSTTYYTQIPLKQAETDVLTFGAAIANNGSSAQPNTQLEVTVNSFTGTSAASTLGVQSVDTIEVSTTYSPDALGNYTVDFDLSSDSTDDFISDNSASFDFEVTEYVYSRDDDNLTTGWSYSNGQNYSILTRYEFNTDDTVKAIQVSFFDNGTFNTDPGSAVEVGIWPVVNAGAPSTIATGGATDFDNPVGGTTIFYTIESGDLNQVITLSYDNPIAVPAGEVMVGFRVQNGTVRTSATDQENAPLQSFVDVGNDGVDGWIDFTPMIRIETYSSDICDGVTIIPTIDAECNPSEFEADLFVDVSTTGSTNFTYEWSTSETGDSIVIDAEGTYSVTVTDEDFCTGTDELIFANGDFDCNLSVDDLNASSFGFGIMPNPNNGIFSLVFDAESSREVEIAVQSLKGEIMHQSVTNIANGQVVDMNLSNLASGIYLVKVTDETSTNVERIVVQ
ncbi:MAG: hypothetical protein Salg2KO_16360 [Salibacteraceae bacterium]